MRHAEESTWSDAQCQQRQRKRKNARWRNSRQVAFIPDHGSSLHFCRIMVGLQIVGDRDNRQQNGSQHTKGYKLQTDAGKQ